MGFFGLCRSPPPARVTVEACSSLPGVRRGSSHSNPRQHERVTSALAIASPSRASDSLAIRIISGGTAALSQWGIWPMTERIREFLRHRREEGLEGPVLVVDLDTVRDNYAAFAKALPDTRVFYAVKANPAPEVLKLLAGLGSCFDT